MTAWRVGVAILVGGVGLLIIALGLLRLYRGHTGQSGEGEGQFDFIGIKVPTGAGLVVLGIIFIVLAPFASTIPSHYLESDAQSNASSPQVSSAQPSGSATTSHIPSPSSVPTSSPSGPSINVTTPKKGTAVSGSQGFVARGTSRGIIGSAYTIWLLDYDGGYTVDTTAKVAANGDWTAPDYPLGTPEQKRPWTLTALVVIANPACATYLEKVQNSSDDYVARLTAGCTVASTIEVSVTRP